MFDEVLIALTFDEKVEILNDYKILRKTSVIEDSLLRSVTKKLRDITPTSFGEAFAMDWIAKEVALIIAYDKINENKE